MKQETSNKLWQQRSIAEVWEIRQSGETLDAYDAYLGLCQEYSVKLGTPVTVHYQQLADLQLSSEQIVDFLLFEVSFLRNRLDLEKSDRRLAEIEALIEELKWPPHFQAIFQAALNAYVKADYSKALDLFLSAKRYSRNELELHFSYFNVILCLESLGYEYKKHLDQFQQTFTPLMTKEWSRSLSQRYVALRARAAFRDGDLDTLQDMVFMGTSGEQASYFLVWILKSPVFSLQCPEKAESRALNCLLESPEGYLHPYRMRTLRGLLINDDMRAEVRPTDEIERLYLWVWQWLVSPDASGLHKLLQFQNHMNDTISGHLTAEDFLLLENSMRWLGFFAGLSDSNIRLSLSSFSHSLSSPIPVLEYERLLLDYFFALRDQNHVVAKDTFTLLSEHTAHHLERFKLPKLASAVHEQAPNNSLGSLSKSVRELLHARTPAIHNGLVVNMMNLQIFIFKDSQPVDDIKSSSLSHLLFCLHHKDAVPVAEVLKACFNYSQYEPVIHDPKLANTLNRANQLFAPYAKISRKGGHVFIKTKPGCLVFTAANDHTLLLAQRDDIHNLLLRRKTIEGHDSQNIKMERKPIVINQWVTRSEFEEIFGISRSSALRKIQQWTKTKLLMKKGVGKASKYKLSPGLERELKLRACEGVQS